MEQHGEEGRTQGREGGRGYFLNCQRGKGVILLLGALQKKNRGAYGEIFIITARHSMAYVRVQYVNRRKEASTKRAGVWFQVPDIKRAHVLLLFFVVPPCLKAFFYVYYKKVSLCLVGRRLRA